MNRADTAWRGWIAEQRVELQRYPTARVSRTINWHQHRPQRHRDPLDQEAEEARWAEAVRILDPDGQDVRAIEKERGKRRGDRPFPYYRRIDISEPNLRAKLHGASIPTGSPYEFCEECGCFASVEETDSVDVGVGYQEFSLGRRCEVCQEDWSAREHPDAKDRSIPRFARSPWFFGFGKSRGPALENVILRLPLPQYREQRLRQPNGTEIPTPRPPEYDVLDGNARRRRLLVKDPYEATSHRQYRSLAWFDTYLASILARVTALLVA